ncbi:phosphonate ABC transporter substrate-binding protein [Jiella sp. MQZ9-1]|uniref:Phosphonate ABC transporter substrate-binding protein n=1 Tax=Jiella flava TaxID=2816857 RepID=A0A939FZM3_9HYPH|nr:phosphonate ABC transporter substrate-binding protein [Jiella flava]MBO0663145.1 phosphonate ABC transporter substrate-binding protein [Jiella flava]MCD2471564.1 phosphonate ABC transporter substrate-binding protein [Jiella flava]
MNFFSKALATAAIALSLGGTAVAKDVTVINFGIISTESQMNLRPKWEPFLKDMAKQTGYEVHPFFATDYAGVIEGMRFGKVQVAWFGNKSAMEAVDRADGQIFAQSTYANGNAGYWSVILAPVDSKLTSVNDLLKCDKTLKFGLGDPNSTSGYLVPMTFVFAKHGVDPQKCFKTVTNANHETNAMAVANGLVDAATNNTENMALIEKNHPDAYKKIKIIWKSTIIPSDPLVISKKLPAAEKEKIEHFVLSYGTDKSTGDAAAEKKVLAGLEWGPFKPSNDDQLLPIRVMEMTKDIAQLKAKTNMDASEKAAKIKDLEAKKAAYEKKLDAMSKTSGS